MTSLDDQVAALEALAAHLERPVDPEEVIATESQLFPGYLVVEGGRAHFLCSRFGAWEVMVSFAADEASGIEVLESFAGSGHELRVLLNGQLIRFSDLDGDTARRVARGLVASGGVVGEGGGRARVAPQRGLKRVFSERIRAPSAYVIGAADAEAPPSVAPSWSGGASTAMPPEFDASAQEPAAPPSWGSNGTSWGVPRDDADEDDDDAPLDAEFDGDEDGGDDGDADADGYTEAELEAILDKWEDRTESARETAKVSAAAEAISPVRRGIVAGVINFVATLFVITGGLDELYLDPDLGFVAGPALAWLLIAVPGGLVAGFGRTFAMIFYGLLAAAATIGVTELVGGAGMASIAGWFILSVGAIRAYYGENALLKAIAVTLGIFIFTGGQAIFMPNGGLALQVGVFWGVHALLEKMTVSKQPA